MNDSQQEQAYHDLANAIITQAVKDYHKACCILDKNPNNRMEQHNKKSIEAFFVSDFFAVITDLNGKTLLEKVKMHILRQQSC